MQSILVVLFCLSTCTHKNSARKLMKITKTSTPKLPAPALETHTRISPFFTDFKRAAIKSQPYVPTAGGAGSNIYVESHGNGPMAEHALSVQRGNSHVAERALNVHACRLL